VASLCRETGISAATFYKWRSKHGVWMCRCSRGSRSLRKRIGG
jgi:hypothetical protein